MVNDRVTGGRIWVAVVAACALMAAPAQAQETEFQVVGAVADSAGGPLRNAMVVALTRSDSTLVKFALSDGEGKSVV